jgi:hypothetical protein
LSSHRYSSRPAEWLIIVDPARIDKHPIKAAVACHLPPATITIVTAPARTSSVAFQNSAPTISAGRKSVVPIRIAELAEASKACVIASAAAA